MIGLRPGHTGAPVWIAPDGGPGSAGAARRPTIDRGARRAVKPGSGSPGAAHQESLKPGRKKAAVPIASGTAALFSPAWRGRFLLGLYFFNLLQVAGEHLFTLIQLVD
ncbi:hypothetical protein A6M21_00810 [Desulfotomaculum copahuensis]|uniref:Uncharacterized protein n=1 Tax=Desulfotomaculum copahuensis TaxID=1838280 RepID=A0A1B7LBY4_9FIRM|nr:hypothetical protein A6M21_00810 [Desulfotomaculum copahuensis]